MEACHTVIDQYRRTIRLLAAKRNACTVTYRLPREILSEIMWNALDHRGSYGLSALERVCRHWRDVALGTPKLWSSVIATSDMHVCVQKTLLARAKQVPLYVDIALTDNPDPIQHGRATLRLLLSNITRIRQLHLTLSEQSMKTLQDLFPSPVTAPQLRSLVLSLGRDHAHVLPMFNLDMLPALTKVIIRSSEYHVNRLLPSVTSSNITIFEMASPGRRVRCIVSSEGLRTALRAMPRLEHLTLKDSLLPTNLILTPSNDPIHLPNVRILDIESSLLTLIWTLDNIHILASAVVTFTYTMDSWELEAGRHTELRDRVTTFLLSEMTDKLRHQKNPLRAAFWDAQQELYTGTVYPDTVYRMRLWIGPEVELSQASSGRAITMVLRGGSVMGYSGKLWESLPLNRVHVLTLRCGGPAYINLSQWKSFQQCLKRMESVETLRFVDWSPESLAHGNVLLWPGKSKGQFVFPRLRELELRGMPAGKVSKKWSWKQQSNTALNGGGSDKDPWPSRGSEVLRRTLTMWEVKRGPLERISLINCDFSTKQIGWFGLRTSIVKFRDATN
ncbi:hypothetical protein EIP91_009134 [Steccherinum ochraceum]|uniref:F-box domain-containing protein n=1 Tax=Steccherinum ochraceum TaxID=92696 RepID=A0A4R0R205_9APHY|nr:hypothetical protein EIP91_009134 [Steccherinum ochraceum]